MEETSKTGTLGETRMTGRLKSLSKTSDPSVVVLIVLCFGVDFCAVWAVCKFFIFLVQFGLLSRRLLENSCSLGLRYVS